MIMDPGRVWDTMMGPATRRSIFWILPLFIVWGTGHAAQGSKLRPSRWGGTIAIAYNDNILGSSEEELTAFETGNPDYWFVIESLDDWNAEIGLWGQWEVASFYRDLRIELGYGRTEWVRNSILSTNTYDAELRQRLPDRSRIDVSFRYQPSVYKRHRYDEDAVTGEPQFRPEAVSLIEFEIRHTRPVFGVSTLAVAGYGVEDRTRWFRERDEKVLSLGVGVDLPILRKGSLRPLYAYERSRSRNEPDLGNDRSYRQHVIQGRLDLPIAFLMKQGRIEFSTRWKFRSYTTTDPDDESRYKRNDRLYSWGVRLMPLETTIAPFVRAEGSGRTVDRPSQAQSFDEEDSYQAFTIQAGIDWSL